MALGAHSARATGHASIFHYSEPVMSGSVQHLGSRIPMEAPFAKGLPKPVEVRSKTAMGDLGSKSSFLGKLQSSREVAWDKGIKSSQKRGLPRAAGRGDNHIIAELPAAGAAALMESGVADRAMDKASFSGSEIGGMNGSFHEGGFLDGMDQPLPKLKLGLATGVKVIPHPAKVEKGGEDAYFVHLMRRESVLGVMDGVGGWADEGVDPALYSNEFVEKCLEALEIPEVENNPQLLLHMAHEKTVAPGAATAIVAMMDANGILRVAHVGDSSLRIIRDGKLVFATEDMMHEFDCPFQFGSMSSDSAADAVVHEIELRLGDVIVMGTDGLYDNLFDRDLEAVVNIWKPEDTHSAERTANALAALGSKHANDPEYESPYILEARQNGYDVPFWQKMLGKKLTGGKLDDITVIVACVVDESSLPSGSTSDDEFILDEHGSGNWVPIHQELTPSQVAAEPEGAVLQ